MNRAAGRAFQADLDRFLLDVDLKNGYESNVEQYARIKGNPYLFDQYIPGRIMLNNDQVLNDIQLNLHRIFYRFK